MVDVDRNESYDIGLRLKVYSRRLFHALVKCSPLAQVTEGGKGEQTTLRVLGYLREAPAPTPPQEQAERAAAWASESEATNTCPFFQMRSRTKSVRVQVVRVVGSKPQPARGKATGGRELSLHAVQLLQAHIHTHTHAVTFVSLLGTTSHFLLH